MAARPGEENVATLYADIHYFYGSPTDNPPHHRFDKGSYVYLFEDPNLGRARLEVANQAGTDDQDAFDGYLDRIHLRYSYKQTCVVTLTVGDIEGNDEWHLPTYDPHNQNKYHYKLHSLDIYFWTHQDALQFVNGIRRVLPPELCEVLDEPGPPPRHANEMSPVIQQLERAAISDAGSIQATPAGVEAGAPTFPGPPVAAVEVVPPPPPQQFAPIAYNPAAPAAPEQVRHREKTPPPEDGVANPLHQTLAYDATTPFSPGLAPSGLGPLSPGIPPPNLQHPPGAPTFPGPPQHSIASPGKRHPRLHAAHSTAGYRDGIALAKGRTAQQGFDEVVGGDAMVVFADVAEAHPLLRKWSGIVRAEAARYGVDWEILKDEDGGVGRRLQEEEEDEREREARVRRDKAARPAERAREGLAW
ncbi:hypothetical protein N0V88_004226 [Collariella sp. IMI 366227]|nr:hypothetical protein N0V88_004226 [Collariella sp. IMI 366227]